MASTQGMCCVFGCLIFLYVAFLRQTEGRMHFIPQSGAFQKIVRAASKIQEVNAEDKFIWSNCGGATDPLRLNSLSITPDPLPIPGNISVAFDGDVKFSLSAPIEMSLHIDKKVLIWVEIPCVDNLGSCTYPDICSMLEPLKDKCPPAFKAHGIPCECPIKSGHYTLPTSLIDMSPLGIPSWLESGEYKVQVKLSQTGQPLACWEMQFSLTH